MLEVSDSLLLQLAPPLLLSAAALRFSPLAPLALGSLLPDSVSLGHVDQACDEFVQHVLQTLPLSVSPRPPGGIDEP